MRKNLKLTWIQPLLLKMQYNGMTRTTWKTWTLFLIYLKTHHRINFYWWKSVLNKELSKSSKLCSIKAKEWKSYEGRSSCWKFRKHMRGVRLSKPTNKSVLHSLYSNRLSGISSAHFRKNLVLIFLRRPTTSTLKAVKLSSVDRRWWDPKMVVLVKWRSFRPAKRRSCNKIRRSSQQQGRIWTWPRITSMVRQTENRALSKEPGQMPLPITKVIIIKVKVNFQNSMIIWVPSFSIMKISLDSSSIIQIPTMRDRGRNRIFSKVTIWLKVETNKSDRAAPILKIRIINRQIMAEDTQAYLQAAKTSLAAPIDPIWAVPSMISCVMEKTSQKSTWWMATTAPSSTQTPIPHPKSISWIPTTTPGTGETIWTTTNWTIQAWS